MDLLKRIVSLLFFLSVPSFCDQIVSTSFNGLNSNESPVIIDPSQAQDLLNVDVTPGGKSVKKRSGYGVYKNLGSGQPLHGGYHAFDSTGNDYQLWGTDTSLFSIVSDGSPLELVSTGTANATWDCTDTQGNSYCVDSSRDAYIRTDGTTMSWFTSPLGTMVESTPDRVVVAGVSGSPNNLYVSQSNTFTNFVVGVNPTDAFVEPIASPGSKITHIRWGCGKLLWWKDQSMGYFDFDDQFTGQVKTVSDSIGTFDNTSAIDPAGRVWFRGQDGHTWMYDCSILTKQSIDVTPNVQVSGKRVSASWFQSTASDFNNGSSYATYTDTTTSPGDVILSGFSDSFINLSSWTQTAGSWATSANTAIINTAGGAGSILTKTSPTHLPSNITLQGDIKLTASSEQADIAVLDSDGSGTGYGVHVSSSFLTTTISIDVCTTATCGFVIASSVVVQDSGFHNYKLTISATNFIQLYVDSTLLVSVTNTSVTGLDTPMLFCGSKNCIFKNYSVYASTGVFYSSVKNAQNLTSWGTLMVSQILNGGTETFYMRSSTNVFTLNSTTPSWTLQSNGNLITISTGTYFQLADTFTVTAATQTPILNDFRINWFEGSAADQAYMLYFDNAIWESVAFSSSTNNYIFKYDLINEGWTLYNFGAGGMLVQNNNLYFGSTLSDNVFNYGTSTSDNGTAINAFWKSKDYSGSDPFLQIQLTNIDSFARKNQGSTLSVDYIMDTSTTTSYSMGLSNTNQSIIQNRKLLPSGKLGQVFNIKYSDTSTSSAWEFLGYRIGFVQLPYRPN